MTLYGRVIHARSLILRLSGVMTTPALTEASDLVIEVLQVDDHAVAHDIDDLRAEYAGREKVEDELSSRIYDGVTRVVAALITADYILFLGEKVDHAALALVSPVYTDDRSKHFQNSFQPSGSVLSFIYIIPQNTFLSNPKGDFLYTMIKYRI